MALEEYIVVIVRTLLIYLTITVIFRLMGKREIGELSIIDLVVFVMIAELAVLAIEDTKTSIILQLLPMIVLLAVQVFLAFISLKSVRFRQIVEGKPAIIINKGKIDEGAMRKHRYNFDDLLLQLREKDIRNISDVDFAILEPSGKLSIFTKDENLEKEDFTLPLIIDGFIQEDNLQIIGQSKKWLLGKLRGKGYTDIDKISFCSYQNGEFFIDEKDEITTAKQGSDSS